MIKEKYAYEGVCQLGDYTIHYRGDDVVVTEINKDGKTKLVFTDQKMAHIQGSVILNEDGQIDITVPWYREQLKIKGKTIEITFDFFA